jgi:LPS sulfotransferase NodH
MFSELRIDPLVLCYEEVVANPRAAVRAVGDYVGAVLAEKAAVEIPAVERQSEADSRAWAERYAASKA